MKYILDTHTLIWLLENDPKLSECAKEIIKDIDNQLLVSVASLWEMTIKMSIGKLKMARSINEIANELTLIDI
jgi:PIN domain nuclease of toxin-antitoxin system